MCEPPSTDKETARGGEPPNPAKPLLYLLGGFCRLGRLATIGWAVLAIVVLLGGAALQPPSRNEVAALIFLALALALVGTVAALAIRKRA